MDESTTDATVQEQAQVTAQPEEQHAEADTTPTSEPTPTTTDEQSTQEPARPDNSDDDLSDWAAKKGYDFSTPEGQAKALKSMREAEKAMHQATQRSSELEKQLGSTPYAQVSDDPTAQRALEAAEGVKLQLEVERWKNANSVSPEQDIAIGEYLAKHQDKAFMLKNGYLSLDDVAAMSGVLRQDPTALKEAGKKEAMEELASKQHSKSPTARATNGAPSTSTSEDAIMDVLTSD